MVIQCYFFEMMRPACDTVVSQEFPCPSGGQAEPEGHGGTCSALRCCSHQPLAQTTGRYFPPITTRDHEALCTPTNVYCLVRDLLPDPGSKRVKIPFDFLRLLQAACLLL
jgi:hypothetical protein